MLAVKATYDNGTVRWKERPSVAGRHELIVIFQDVDPESSTQPSRADATAPAATWDGFKALVGCVAERTDGAERHDGYLAGTEQS